MYILCTLRHQHCSSAAGDQHKQHRAIHGSIEPQCTRRAGPGRTEGGRIGTALVCRRMKAGLAAPGALALSSAGERACPEGPACACRAASPGQKLGHPVTPLQHAADAAVSVAAAAAAAAVAVRHAGPDSASDMPMPSKSCQQHSISLEVREGDVNNHAPFTAELTM